VCGNDDETREAGASDPHGASSQARGEQGEAEADGKRPIEKGQEWSVSEYSLALHGRGTFSFHGACWSATIF